MCCIFTCCGWMIDLIQRLWTFTMSCCISSAVCCSLFTASMCGVALGYNYSLAEYIDLKETNVSVYLKRGIFDDDIADDVDWRRSGHMPVKGHINDDNLLTGGPEDESLSVQPGRRLDDSIHISNDKNSFEGALMKLTAKPPAERESSTYPEVRVHEALEHLPSRRMHIDELKAIQSDINLLKSAEAEKRLQKQQLPLESGRRLLPGVSMLPPFATTLFNSLRLAVPDQGFNNPSHWLGPKLQTDFFTTQLFDDYSFRLTLPTPITAKPPAIRPTKARPRQKPTTIFKPTLTKEHTFRIEDDVSHDFEQVLDKIDKSLALDKFDDLSFRDEEIAAKRKTDPNQSEEDYEEDIKGIPIRRKRHTGDDKTTKKNSNVKFKRFDQYSSANLIPTSDKMERSMSKNHNENLQSFRILQNDGQVADSTFLKLIMSCTSS